MRDRRRWCIFTNPESRGVGIGSQSGERSLMTYREFLELQAQHARCTSAMAASSSLHRVQARIDGGEPEEIALSLVSRLYFDTLGVPAPIGRTFSGAASRPRAACRRR